MLTEGHDILRAVIEGTPDAVFVKDLEGRYLLVNSACARFIGRPLEEIIGKRDRDLYPPDTARQFVDDDRRTIKTGATQVFEGMAYGAGGVQAYRVTKGVYRDEQGKVVGIFGISHDITDRRRAEEERVERVREQAARAAAEAESQAKDELLTALRVSEERYRSLLENANDIIYSHDLQGKYLTINRAGETITGYTREEVLGGMNIAQVVVPEHLEHARQMTLRKLKDHSPTVYEVDIKTKDGRRLTFEVSTRIAYRDGLPSEVEGIARDVTARKRAEEERERLLEREQKAREEAENANRLKDEFLATVSHELRTPLTSIIGWVHMIRAGQLEPETTMRALETVERSAKAQAQLINDLLDVSRIVTGKLHLDVRPTSLASVVDASVASVQLAAEAKNIRIQTRLDPDVLLLLVDPDRLQQVLWNLLYNAIKFTPEGGRVEVRTSHADSRMLIEVSDNGQGIHPKFLPHVFERFRQADQSTTRAHGGLGLGLAIVRYLVELHGGIVSVESAGEGLGATFKVSLPMTVATTRQRVEESTDASHVEKSKAHEVPLLKGLSVLVVDDDEDVCRLMAVLLRKKEARVTVATSTREALSALEREKFDVLLSDIGMPGEDGYALIRKVRALPAEKGGTIPAAALTAYARDEDRVKALLAGFQIHIPKPINPTEVNVVVASLAGRR
jgi:PAS domain S-box-containing protein